MSHGATANMLLSTTLFFLGCIVALKNRKGYPFQEQPPFKSFPKGPNTWKAYSEHLQLWRGSNDLVPEPEGKIFRVATVNVGSSSTPSRERLGQFQKDLRVFKPRILVSTDISSRPADNADYFKRLKEVRLEFLVEDAPVAINSDLPLKLIAKEDWVVDEETSAVLAVSVFHSVVVIGAKVTSKCDRFLSFVEKISKEHSKVIIAGDFTGVWVDDPVCTRVKRMLVDPFEEVNAEPPNFTGLWRKHDKVLATSGMRDAIKGGFVYYTDAFPGTPVMTDFEINMPPILTKPPSMFTSTTTDQSSQYMAFLKWGSFVTVIIVIIVVIVYLVRR